MFDQIFKELERSSPDRPTQLADSVAARLLPTIATPLIQDLMPGARSETPNFAPIFDALETTETVMNAVTGDPRIFHEVLHKLNENLQKMGLLPGMEIFGEDTNGDRISDGYGIAQTSGTGRSTGGPSGDSGGGRSGNSGGGRPAVIGKSGPAPEVSPQQQQSYEKMGFPDGAKMSAPANGGNEGRVNPESAQSQVSDANREALIKEALQLAGEDPNDVNNINAINMIVEKESGWNPNAINLWDSNAAAGHPSQGLMQTIPTTFQENALPGYDKDLTDPLSNLIAGIRYSRQRYGGVQNVPGVVAVNSGSGYVGY